MILWLPTKFGFCVEFCFFLLCLDLYFLFYFFLFFCFICFVLFYYQSCSYVVIVYFMWWRRRGWGRQFCLAMDFGIFGYLGIQLFQQIKHFQKIKQIEQFQGIKQFQQIKQLLILLFSKWNGLKTSKGTSILLKPSLIELCA